MLFLEIGVPSLAYSIERLLLAGEVSFQAWLDLVQVMGRAEIYRPQVDGRVRLSTCGIVSLYTSC